MIQKLLFGLNLNTTDHEIMKEILHKLYSVESVNKQKLLVVSKYTERTRINLILLQIFLQELNQHGMFIAVDRPHQYVSYLLNIHKICQKKLIYVDMVSRISGEYRSENEAGTVFTNGPYDIGFLHNFTTKGFAVGDLPQCKVDIKRVEFILIDDLAALQKYNAAKNIERFVLSFVSTIEQLKGCIGIIVLDVNKNRDLYKLIEKSCDAMLFVNLSNNLVKFFEERRAPLLPAPLRAASNFEKAVNYSHLEPDRRTMT
jgi:hypothetical protein